MMTSLQSSFIIILGLVFTTIACQQTEEGPADDQLLGRWELSSATVNGSQTDRLRDLYFVFLPDTSLQTNILGSETNFKYHISEDIIVQQSDPLLNYHLQEITDSTLMLQTEIRGSTFSISLRKARPKINTESGR